MAKDRPLMLRLDPAQHELWVEAAKDEGMRLSEWIREKCDAALTERETRGVAQLTAHVDVDVQSTGLEPRRTKKADLASPAGSGTAARTDVSRSASTERSKTCSNARHHRKGSFCKLCMTMF